MHRQIRRLPFALVLPVVILFLTFSGTASADLLVASNSGILRFSSTGAPLGTFVPLGSGGLTPPGTPAFGPDGNLYVPDVAEVLRFDGKTGAFIDSFVPAGSGGLTHPTFIVFGPDGNLYVSDYFGNSSGVVRRYNGTTGASMGPFTVGRNLVEPVGLVFGPDGNLYVADAVNVEKFNGATGVFMATFVPSGSGGLSGPGLLAFGSDGNLYVASAHTGVIRYNGTTGAFIDQFVPEIGVRADGGFAFGPDGNLYVGYFHNSDPIDFVLRYNGQTGALIDDFIPSGIGIIGGMVFTPGSGVPTEVVPNQGGNAGTVTVRVIGSGFQAGAIVSLTGLGPDIVGSNTTVPYPSAASFNLAGATPGVRNVVITNPGKTSVTLPAGFKSGAGRSPRCVARYNWQRFDSCWGAPSIFSLPTEIEAILTFTMRCCSSASRGAFLFRWKTCWLLYHPSIQSLTPELNFSFLSGYIHSPPDQVAFYR